MHLTGQDKWYLTGKWPVFESEEKGVETHMKSLMSQGLVQEKDASSHSSILKGKMWTLTSAGIIEHVKLKGQKTR